MSSGERKSTTGRRAEGLAGAEAALRRAARRAQQRAREAAKVPAERRSEEESDGTRGVETGRDPRNLTFSQAQGYEEIPGLLKLEELPQEARTRIWNLFYVHLDQSKRFRPLGEAWIDGAWAGILQAKHVFHDNLPADEWTADFMSVCRNFRNEIERLPFNKVFDLIQFVLRHPACPPNFISAMKQVFAGCRLAYTIDEGDPPTIVPAVTADEGITIIESLETLREAGLRGSAEHLREASESINRGDWAGSIRESIHAVESVARRIAPEETDTLTRALNSIDNRQPLHSNLKEGLKALYWYTSDEQGVRHSLLDREKASVGVDEAVFMLGACASFASYLWRKHAAGGAS